MMVTGTRIVFGMKFMILSGLGLALVGIPLYRHFSKKNKTKKLSQKYKNHHLLLIVEAQRLDKNLEEFAFISKNEAEKIISNATLAYCFADGDSNGQNISNGVQYLDDPIDYSSSQEILVELYLSADVSISTEKLDRVEIKEALNPNEKVQIKKIKILRTAYSIEDFYSI
jgi:hypothetical protein